MALLLTEVPFSLLQWQWVLGLAATCSVASANYVINEWLDRTFDQYHPKKKGRASVRLTLNPWFIYGQYLLFLGLGLGLGLAVNTPFMSLLGLFALMGAAYNVRPLRLKERPYLDVLSESFNNPLRFLLGWSLVAPNQVPPVSILFGFWMGGAFLMAIKRFAEFRFINNPSVAALYRWSFRHYSENSLLISAFFYGLASSFFLGIFLVKYRLEYILALPGVAGLFAWYLKIGLSSDSAAQQPEKLYRERPLLIYIFVLILFFALLTVYDLPYLDFLFKSEALHQLGW